MCWSVWGPCGVTWWSTRRSWYQPGSSSPHLSSPMHRHPNPLAHIHTQATPAQKKTRLTPCPFCKKKVLVCACVCSGLLLNRTTQGAGANADNTSRQQAVMEGFLEKKQVRSLLDQQHSASITSFSTTNQEDGQHTELSCCTTAASRLPMAAALVRAGAGSHAALLRAAQVCTSALYPNTPCRIGVYHTTPHHTTPHRTTMHLQFVYHCFATSVFAQLGRR